MLKKRKAGIRMTTQGSKYNKRVEFNPGVAFKHNTRQMKTINTKVDIKPECYNFMKQGETFITKCQEYEKIYTEKTGQKVQKKAQPLREMIVITDSHITLEHLKTLTEEIQKLTKWKALHIAHHKDEGHYKMVNGKQVEPKEFITNYHAHIVFECYDKKTGKSILLNKKQMSKLQDLAAIHLDMPRGEINSGRVHLEPEQYKQAQIDKDKAIEKAIEENTLIFDTLLTTEKQNNKNLSAVKDYISSNLNETTKSNKKLSLLTQELQKTVKALEQENSSLKSLNKTLNNELLAANDDIEKLKEQNTEITNYFLTAKKELEDLQLILDTLGLGEIKTKLKEAKKKFKTDYDSARDLLKASGIATQQDYQELKTKFTEITEKLSALNKTNIPVKINDMNI